MQLVEQKKSVKESQDFKSYRFGIAEDSIAHIMGILRGSLYSDKVGSLIREISSNALDAHVAKGTETTPFLVTLPNKLNSNFKVRDYGFGLPESDIENLYCMYGRSTKRGDNSSIGCFGIGKFAPLAYGDNFIVNSYHKGEHKSYCVFVDDTKIGKISKMSESATTEPDGLEVVVPVRAEDTSFFVEKAVKFFENFKVKPIIKGADVVFEEREISLSGSFWTIYKKDRIRLPIAIMGGVAYPLEFGSLKIQGNKEDEIRPIFNTGIVIEFGIGELEVSASREKLQYTDKTIKAILAKVEKIIGEISKKVQEKIEKCETIFQAKKVYGSIFSYGSALFSISESIKNLTWKGVPIQNSDISFNHKKIGHYSGSMAYVTKYSKNWRGTRISSNKRISSCNCMEEVVFVLNDKRVKSGITNRIYDLIFKDNKQVYVVTVNDNAFFKKYDLDKEKDFILLSSLPVCASSTTGSGGGVVRSSKHTSTQFVLDSSSPKNRWNMSSSFWTEKEVDLKKDSGVYVEINRFESNTKEGKRFEHPMHLNQKVSKLGDFLGIKIPKIYGFKSKVMDEVKKNKNFIHFSDFAQKALKDFVVKNKISQKTANRRAWEKNQNCWWKLKNSISKIKSDSPMKDALDKIKSCESVAGLKDILDFLNSYPEFSNLIDEQKPIYDLVKLNEEVLKRYPMLSCVETYFWENDNKYDPIINYINSMDKLNELNS